MRAAVVGHIEWVTFVRVAHVPVTGEIVHAFDSWETVGGGGAGAAVQLAKLSGGCDFFTALGDDELGHRARTELESMGVTVHSAVRPEATRRAITLVDATGERTITVLGARLAPAAAEPLPWERLAETDAVYVTASDAPALRLARAARVTVATARILDLLRSSGGVRLDAVVGSLNDASEIYPAGALEPAPRLLVRTDGERGGTFETDEGERGSFAATPADPVVDRYGAGDSFAAGLTFGLGAGMPPGEALELAARCGAAVVTGRGPYEGQLTSPRRG